MSSNQAGKAQETKDRLAKAGAEAKKRFAGTKLGQKIEQTATEARDLAKSVAKAQVDQMLLNLQHKGLDLTDSNELVHRIGQTVLRRADEVREKLEGHPMAPAWLKDLKLGDKIDGLNQKFTESMGAKTQANESTSVVDATASQASAAMQPETIHAKAGKGAGESIQATRGAETLTKTVKTPRAKTPKRNRAATGH